MDIQSCKNLLSQFQPMLKLTNIKPIQQGWDSYTIARAKILGEEQGLLVDQCNKP